MWTSYSVPGCLVTFLEHQEDSLFPSSLFTSLFSSSLFRGWGQQGTANFLFAS